MLRSRRSTPAPARPNNRLQGMRGQACFDRTTGLCAGPAPLTLVSLVRSGTGGIRTLDISAASGALSL